MRRLMIALFAVPALFLALTVPSAVAAATATRTPAAGAQRTATPSDSQIEATIRTKLAKSKIGRDGFKFHVQRGVVTWEGMTDVIQHKGSATRMARTAGAVQVINNIQISASAKKKAVSNLKRAEVVQ